MTHPYHAFILPVFLLPGALFPWAAMGLGTQRIHNQQAQCDLQNSHLSHCLKVCQQIEKNRESGSDFCFNTFKTKINVAFACSEKKKTNKLKLSWAALSWVWESEVEEEYLLMSCLVSMSYTNIPSSPGWIFSSKLYVNRLVSFFWPIQVRMTRICSWKHAIYARSNPRKQSFLPVSWLS